MKKPVILRSRPQTDMALRTILRRAFTAPHRLRMAPAGATLKRRLQRGFHCHAGWELFAILRGELLFQVAGQPPAPIPSGHLLLVPPQCLHMSIHELPQPRRLRLLALNLPDKDSAYGALYAGSLWERESWMLSEDELGAWLRLLGEPPAALMGRVAEGWSGGVFSRERVSSLLRLLISALGEIALDATPAQSRSGDRKTSAVLAMLNNEYYKPDLCLEHVAAATGMSASRLASLFKKNTGRSIHQALVAIRLQRAQNLLKDGSLSIKEVAALTGWSNQLYFSAAFRKHLGLPPSQARTVLSSAPNA